MKKLICLTSIMFFCVSFTTYGALPTPELLPVLEVVKEEPTPIKEEVMKEETYCSCPSCLSGTCSRPGACGSAGCFATVPATYSFTGTCSTGTCPASTVSYGTSTCVGGSCPTVSYGSSYPVYRYPVTYSAPVYHSTPVTYYSPTVTRSVPVYSVPTVSYGTPTCTVPGYHDSFPTGSCPTCPRR